MTCFCLFLNAVFTLNNAVVYFYSKNLKDFDEKLKGFVKNSRNFAKNSRNFAKNSNPQTLSWSQLQKNGQKTSLINAHSHSLMTLKQFHLIFSQSVVTQDDDWVTVEVTDHSGQQLDLFTFFQAGTRLVFFVIMCILFF